MEKMRFLILGEDARQSYLKEMLQQKGHFVTYMRQFAPDACKISQYDVVLLSIPDGAAEYAKLKRFLRSGQLVFGCNLPVKEEADVCAAGVREKVPDVHLIEYMRSDRMAYKNAVATAEGALAEAILNSDINLHGSRSLVTGFGRCAEILADKLKALNSHVTIMARNADQRAKAFAYGYEAIGFNAGKMKAHGPDFDFVFNTVPRLVLDEQMLSLLPETSLIIDIASKPGGVDFEYCRSHGIHAKLISGIPGKYAPKTSAEYLLEVIEEHI